MRSRKKTAINTEHAMIEQHYLFEGERGLRMRSWIVYAIVLQELQYVYAAYARAKKNFMTPASAAPAPASIPY
jgi:hypothetical protein